MQVLTDDVAAVAVIRSSEACTPPVRAFCALVDGACALSVLGDGNQKLTDGYLLRVAPYPTLP